MTVWGEVNTDALTLAPDEISHGKRLGFLDALEAARQEEYMFRSQFGAEVTLREMELENLQRVKEATGIYVGRLEDRIVVPRTRAEIAQGVGADEEMGRSGAPPTFKPYTETLEAFGFGAPLPQGVRERDAQLAEFQKKYPNAGILTYSEMYKNVIERANKVRIRASRDTSWAGSIGWFIGGTLGAVDPRTNPINFMALPIGGAGKTAFMRIGSQALGQGAAEALAQFTGARTNMRLLSGQTPSAGETALAIGGAAVGGAALQGVGEAALFAARRWFRNVPGDPAPEPPAPTAPVSAPAKGTVADREAALVKRMAPTLEAEQAITRAVQAVAGSNANMMRAARSDFAYVHDALSRFDGRAPWEIPPPQYTRLAQFDNDVQAPRLEARTPGETVDDIARRIDPETFRAYDLLAAKRAEQQALLDQRGHVRQQELDRETAGLRNEIAKQEKRLETAKRRKAKDTKATLDTLRSKLGDIEQNAPPSLGMTAAQDAIDRLDGKIADMSQALARAYARAQGKWEVQQETLKAVQDMVAQGRTEINLPPYTPVDAAELAFFNRPTVADLAPELRSTIAKPVPEGTDAVDEVKRVANELLKQSDEQADTFRQYAAKLVKPKEEKAKGKDKAKEGASDEDAIEVEGFAHPVKLTDDIVVEREDGTPETISVRTMLERLQESEEVLQAVTTCSVAKTSVTA